VFDVCHGVVFVQDNTAGLGQYRRVVRIQNDPFVLDHGISYLQRHFDSLIRLIADNTEDLSLTVV
jgi:hypothetical protein